MTITAILLLLVQQFEVASVKPTPPQERVIALSTYPGGRITITNFTLHQLIEQAYAVERFQVVGGPSWIDRDPYSIEAKPPSSSESSKFSPANPKVPPPPEERIMLQGLLADRFQLKLHREKKEGTILVLIAKEPKLNPAKNPAEHPVVSYWHRQPDVYSLEGQNATMPLLASRLSQLLGRKVDDQTSLPGSFDFKFSFEENSLVTAVQEIGLKLESRKATIETLVVDRAEKPSN